MPSPISSRADRWAWDGAAPWRAESGHNPTEREMLNGLLRKLFASLLPRMGLP
jgi:hypothetical protein